MTEAQPVESPEPRPMDVTIQGHVFAELPFFDVIDDETVIVDLHNRPDLTHERGALQGGLVATLSFGVLTPRRPIS